MTIPTGPAYTYRAAVARILDADSFIALIDLGLGVSTQVPIRLRGVACPEMNEPGGPEARDELRRLLDFNGVAYATTFPLLLRTHKTRVGTDARSFERYVVEVWRDGVDVAQALIDSGHGRKV